MFCFQYRAGKVYRESWNEAVFGPTMPSTLKEPSSGGNSHALRAGDTLILDNALFGDASGRWGVSNTTGQGFTMWRNGKKLASIEPGVPQYEVPAESGRYRFETFAERDFPLSRRVEAAWEFTSGHVDGFAALPLTAVGFQPKLDASHRAPKNAVMAVPVKIWQVPQSGAASVTSLRVEVSADDGHNWAPGKVSRFGSYWLLWLRNPRDGYVSLRVAAEDAAGNKVEQTIIRAYGVR